MWSGLPVCGYNNFFRENSINHSHLFSFVLFMTIFPSFFSYFLFLFTYQLLAVAQSFATLSLTGFPEVTRLPNWWEDIIFRICSQILWCIFLIIGLVRNFCCRGCIWLRRAINHYKLKISSKLFQETRPKEISSHHCAAFLNTSGNATPFYCKIGNFGPFCPILGQDIFFENRASSLF